MKIKGILVSDFDGTMTKHDFYDLVCAAFPEISTKGFWRQYEAGEITHFEALRSIFSLIRAPESKLLEIVESMEIEPKLAQIVQALDDHGWKVIVASAGCDWYIRRLLKKSKVAIEVYANPGEFFPDKGLLVSLPQDSPYCSQEMGINKSAVVRQALKESSCVAFAGDGRPDLAPAMLVKPVRRFAKSWLAKKLRETGESYVAFNRWSEIAENIIKGESAC